MGSFLAAHLKHNMDLVSRLRNLVPGVDKFVSFDVPSLFTNAPINPTLDFLKRKLPELDLDFPIPIECLLELVELCTKYSYFQFDSNFNKQIFGMAMGNPLSPVLANFLLEHVETEILPLYTGIFPNLWLRYVDDVLCLVSPNFQIDAFLHYLNSLYPTLKFTFEFELNHKMPFLDVLIHNCYSHLKFSVYRKPTNAEAYLHYYSCTAD